jgi:prepilin-type N-terminal cleavage/methylation domain-containing protein/prepilin-type processing-associated H-X9-DG protein
MKQPMQSFPKPKALGFTLLELLVVMAVILVLAALLLPALQRARARGQTAACINNLRQLGLAAASYSSDAGRFPTILEWLYDRPAQAEGDLTTGKLYPYLKSKATYLCPTQARKVTNPIWSPAPLELHPDHSYAINCMMCHAHDVTACLAPARTVFFVEAANLPNDRWGSLAEPYPIRFWTNAPVSAPAFPHGQRGNLLMVDSHVLRRTQKEIQDAFTDRYFWYPTGNDDRSGGL